MRKLLSTITIAVAALSTCAVLASCGPKEDPEIAVVSVSVSQRSLTLEVGGSTSLTATVSPSTATNKTVTWASSNQAVATVNNGTVTAVSPGTVTITATAGGKSGTCSVTVNKKMIAVTSVSVDQDKLDMVEDESVTLEATVNPSNADEKTVTWESSDKVVASVDQSGNVTALKEGTTMITATVGGKTATCVVTVSKKYIEVESVDLDKTELTLTEGEIDKLTAIVSPDYATEPEVTWVSDNPEVAIVEDGVVTAVKEGTAVITAKASGYTAECQVVVRKQEYQVPLISEVDVPSKYVAWGSDIRWYYRITETQQQFIYPHILVSYIADQWYLPDNLEYIILGELPVEYPCENVGKPTTFTDYHADEGCRHILFMVPSATIKACNGHWSDLEAYILRNPEKLFMVSCAADALGGDFRKDLLNDPEYGVLKSLLAKENIIVSVASGNNYTGVITKELNENIDDQPSGGYSSSSVNSGKNNKYTIVGYNPGYENIFIDDNYSLLPVGYGKGNTVVPFALANDSNRLINWQWEKDDESSTHSSWPTAAFSGTLGNFLSILMRNNPGITLERASSIMQEKYFRAEKMRYKDEDGTVKEGGDWHFFKTDVFIANEILHNDAVDSALSSGTEEIVLPSAGGLCYTGPGIQFEVDGVVHEMTDSNRDVFISSVSDGKEIKWTFNRSIANKYASESTDINIRIMDRDASLIPDISRSLSVAL